VIGADDFVLLHLGLAVDGWIVGMGRLGADVDDAGDAVVVAGVEEHLGALDVDATAEFEVGCAGGDGGGAVDDGGGSLGGFYEGLVVGHVGEYDVVVGDAGEEGAVAGGAYHGANGEAASFAEVNHGRTEKSGCSGDENHNAFLLEKMEAKRASYESIMQKRRENAKLEDAGRSGGPDGPGGTEFPEG